MNAEGKLHGKISGSGVDEPKAEWRRSCVTDGVTQYSNNDDV